MIIAILASIAIIEAAALAWFIEERFAQRERDRIAQRARRHATAGLTAYGWPERRES